MDSTCLFICSLLTVHRSRHDDPWTMHHVHSNTLHTSTSYTLTLLSSLQLASCSPLPPAPAGRHANRFTTPTCAKAGSMSPTNTVDPSLETQWMLIDPPSVPIASKLSSPCEMISTAVAACSSLIWDFAVHVSASGTQTLT
jgi:hypothetical protein